MWHGRYAWNKPRGGFLEVIAAVRGLKHWDRILGGKVVVVGLTVCDFEGAGETFYIWLLRR